MKRNINSRAERTLWKAPKGVYAPSKIHSWFLDTETWHRCGFRSHCWWEHRSTADESWHYVSLDSICTFLLRSANTLFWQHCKESYVKNSEAWGPGIMLGNPLTFSWPRPTNRTSKVRLLQSDPPHLHQDFHLQHFLAKKKKFLVWRHVSINRLFITLFFFPHWLKHSLRYTLNNTL